MRIALGDGVIVLELSDIVSDFGTGLKLADSRRPQAVNVRTKMPYQAGIGPHAEAKTVSLVLHELAGAHPGSYANRFALGVPYPEYSRQRCDLCLGMEPSWDWAIEVKMLRFLGDNGKPNDNILMQVLSPYPQHRSALTDCVKLSETSLGARKGILIYGFDHVDWPLDPAIDAFERLATSRAQISGRHESTFADLVHPVHQKGRIFAWELH